MVADMKARHSHYLMMLLQNQNAPYPPKQSKTKIDEVDVDVWEESDM